MKGHPPPARAAAKNDGLLTVALLVLLGVVAFVVQAPPRARSEVDRLGGGGRQQAASAESVLARVSAKAAALAGAEWDGNAASLDLADLADDEAGLDDAHVNREVDALVAADMGGLEGTERHHHLLECSCDCEKENVGASDDDARCACSCDHSRIQQQIGMCPNHGRLEQLRKAHAQLRRCPMSPLRPLDQLAAATGCPTPSLKDPAALPLGSLPVFVQGSRNVRAATARTDSAAEADEDGDGELQPPPPPPPPVVADDSDEFTLPLGLLVNQQATQTTDKKYTIVRGLLPATPHEALAPIVFRSCAVVGSSERLLTAMMGPDIDSHDAVWRVNGAPVGGTCAMYAGSKTHVRVLSARQVRHFASLVEARPFVPFKALFPDLEVGRNELMLVTRASAQDFAMFATAARRAGIQVRWLSQSTYAGAKELLQGYRRRLMRAKLPFQVPPDAAEPSGGMLALYTALQACETVTTFGLGGGTKDGPLGARAKAYAEAADGTDEYLVDKMQPRYYKARQAEASDLQVGSLSSHSLELERLLIGALARSGTLAACGGIGGHGSLEVYGLGARLGMGLGGELGALDHALGQAQASREGFAASLAESSDGEEEGVDESQLSAREREELIEKRAQAAKQAEAAALRRKGAAPRRGAVRPKVPSLPRRGGGGGGGADASTPAGGSTVYASAVASASSDNGGLGPRDKFERMANKDMAKIINEAVRTEASDPSSVDDAEDFAADPDEDPDAAWTA